MVSLVDHTEYILCVTRVFVLFMLCDSLNKRDDHAIGFPRSSFSLGGDLNTDF